MNALVKKEIRLLLPSWLVVLSLAILAPWLSGKDSEASFAWTPLVLFFGIILLAVDSFGREFSLGTFPALMSQPMERRQIWRTKIAILFSGAALICIASTLSNTFLFQHASKLSVWAANPKVLTTDYHNALLGGTAAIFLALTGGLWTTLLFRQISAAFWITFLTPLGLLMTVIFFVPAQTPEEILVPSLYGLAVIYCVAGFWLAHRLFHRSQDAAWTGGVISFSTWRYLDTNSKTTVSKRVRKPITALCKKEFQLHSISLFCAGALLVLHLAVILMRVVHGKFEHDSFMSVIGEFFWIFWLIMPLVIGCMAVAEERKLGIVDGQFCLPVSRRLQFVIKFIPALFFGMLLGGVMPLVLEGAASLLGAPTDLFQATTNNYNGSGVFSGHLIFVILMLVGSVGFVLAGFLASTLAKNFLQALSIAIVICVASCFVIEFLGAGHFTGFGTKLWNPRLLNIITILTLIVFIPWLAWRNFSRPIDGGQLWRRNIFGIVGATLFVFVSSALIYNRVWEIFEPAEPTHGAARFPMTNPPKLSGNMDGGLSLRHADGRVWFDSLGYNVQGGENNKWHMVWRALFLPRPESIGPQDFIAGSNWASTTAWRIHYWKQTTSPSKSPYLDGYLDTIGIQTDGSLWISSDAKPKVWTGANMVRVGTETNWQQVMRMGFSQLLLLKTDGTLWQWGTTDRFDWIDSSAAAETNWPTVRAATPHQIGTNSDWREIFNNWRRLVQKTDGTVWGINFEDKTFGAKIEGHETKMDQVVPSTFSQGNNLMAYVRKDGTLWIGKWIIDAENPSQSKLPVFLRMGADTNWLTTVMNQDRLIALKADGTLWQWQLIARTAEEAIKIPPTRLGIHNDWIGLTDAWWNESAVFLAADGSLWLWPEVENNDTLMRPPKQPQLLANVFGSGK